MHRCLQIPEIILEVVRSLPLTLSHTCFEDGCALILSNVLKAEFVEREVALAFALTCKAFLNPGLDALWYHMHSIRPLVACAIPEGFGTWKAWMKESPRLLNPSSVKRLQFYAHRIRILSVPEDDLPPPAYRLLSTAFSDIQCPMLPNLCHLFWNTQKTTTFPYLSLFAGPSLENVKLYPFQWNSSVDEPFFSVISTFAAHSPSLVDVQLEEKHAGHDKRDCRNTALILSALPSLESVILEANISAEMLYLMAGMRRLKALHLAFEKSRFYFPATSLAPLEFASLEDMTVHDAKLSDLAILFQSFLPRLNKIKVIDATPTKCTSASSIERYIKAVCKACSPDTLAWFRIFGDDDYTHEHLSSFLIDNTVFSPLLEFRNMQHFSISACEPTWDDDLLAVFASAWPNLIDIDLKAHKGHPSKLTIQGLVPFAKHCPLLERIWMQLAPWDSSLGGPPKQDWGDRSSAPPLCVVLRRYHQPELEPDAVSYLEEVFPNLDEIMVNRYPE